MTYAEAIVGIKKWGIGVRLPANAAKAAHLHAEWRRSHYVHQIFFLFFLSLCSVGTRWAQASATLDYEVLNEQKTVIQKALVQNGTVFIKAAGGDANTDILFERAENRLILIDHRKQRYTPITEDSLKRLSGQLEDVAPLVRGLSAQLKNLDPRQKAKWEKMLGGVPLDGIGQAEREIQHATLKHTGQKTIAGVACEQMRMTGTRTSDAEFCLASAQALALTPQDAETLQALIQFVQAVARKAHGLASQFGLELAAVDIDEINGIPLQIRTLKGKHPLSLTFQHCDPHAAPVEDMKVPAHYKAEKLRLW